MTIHTIGTLEEWLAAATLGAADWVCLAPAPTFAMMALLTGVLRGGQQDMFCSAAQYALPLSGMLWMYLLMNASHSAPWLKLISSRRTVPNDSERTLHGRPEDTLEARPHLGLRLLQKCLEGLEIGNVGGTGEQHDQRR
jgi:hypothetical protein